MLCACSACSYDWTIGDAGVDAASAADAAVDVTSSDASRDGAGPAPDASGQDAAPPDGGPPPHDAGPDCMGLEADVKHWWGYAVQCMSGPSACLYETTNECGCTVVLGADTTNTYTHSYIAAVAALTSSGCTIVCSGSCPTVMKGLCVVSDAGSTGFACYQ